MPAYSFQDVAATIVGPTGSSQLAAGAGAAAEGISFEPINDKNTMVTGADGGVMHSLHAETSGRIVVRLLKTSPTNAVLQQMYDAQTLSASLHGQNTIVCLEKASGDVTTATQCAFRRKPPISYQREANIIEWEFDAGHMVTVLGTY